MIRFRNYTFASSVVALAVLLAAWNGSLSWMLIAGFAFVVFPNWRGKLFRLVEKAISKARHNDTCDPR